MRIREQVACGLALAFGLFAAPAAAEGIFRGNFEDEGATLVHFATVELRAADETVKASAHTDQYPQFPRFAPGTIQAGDAIVVYGGTWEGPSFAGEFRLLLDQPSAQQSVNAITTLVSAVAASNLVGGATPAQRLANAVGMLQGFGLIDGNWRSGSPARVNYPLSQAVQTAGGIQNWTTQLLAELAAGEIGEDWMATFPHANGGVLEVGVQGDASGWLPGDGGALSLSVATGLETAPAWTFSAVDVPAWMTVLPNGDVLFTVPPNQEPGTLQPKVYVLNPGTGIGRELAFAFRVENASVAASQSFDATGGTFWHPDGAVGIEIPAGALAEPTTLQWVDHVDETGETVRLFRTVPADRVFLLPLRFVSAAPTAAPNGASCSFQPDDEWYEKACDKANFAQLFRVEQNSVSLVVPTNRISNGAYCGPSPFGLRLGVADNRVAFTLSARCENCQNREGVLFIHGYTLSGDLGGGAGTWGDLPALIQESTGGSRFAAYEFSYRSNARFEDIAADLGRAIEFIHDETGQPVHIVAHSFGGLVARAYLQGLAEANQASGMAAHPYVASLLTVGTPHSGIADSPRSLHGVAVPEGEDGLGELIEACGQLSCWQAGSNVIFTSSAIADGAPGFYGVANEPGETIAQLSDFASHPLPVPVLSLVGMRAKPNADYAGAMGYSRVQQGDGLISYQGQRFAPALSCTGVECINYPISAGPKTQIAGQSLGNTLFEQVLGARASVAQPVPGVQVPSEPAILNRYRHTSPGPSNEREVLVDRSAHMPGLALPEPRRHTGSSHDTFNRVLSWLTDRQVEPVERYVEVTVTGSGAVEALAGGVTHRCESTHPQPCVFRIGDAQATLHAVPAAGSTLQADGFQPSTCATPLEGCTRYIGAYEKVSANFTQNNQAALRVVVLGAGQVETSAFETCAGDCTYFFAPGSLVLLTQQALAGGVWNQWSGACHGNAQNCAATVGAAGSVKTVTASFTATAPTPTTGALNDTGIQFCGAYPSGNNDPCTGSEPLGQDADYGRDALAAMGQLTKIGGGNAGFDFTKISNAGNPLPVSAALGSGTNDWACTRDNVTGLIWEVKTDDGGLRDQGNTYTWYDPASPDGNPGTANGGSCVGSDCDTTHYRDAVNAEGLCGASDWRMPGVKELEGIADFGRYNPAIDSAYFPNSPSSYFWSGSPYASDSNYAWYVNFLHGYADYFAGLRSTSFRVRLVRAGQ